MKKVWVLLLISISSSWAFSQEMLKPVAHKLVNTQYKGGPLSLDGYLKTNKEKCTNVIAEQILKLEKDKNADFLNYTKAIGSKLKQVDDRCKFFRFELIDYVEDGTIDMRFAYRCYATKAGTLPHQRVSHIDPLVINPAVFYKNEDRIKEKCDALKIISQLNAKPAKTMNGGSSTTTPRPVEKTSGPAFKPKKGSSQN